METGQMDYLFLLQARILYSGFPERDLYLEVK
jgi:hypothetical protein